MTSSAGRRREQVELASSLRRTGVSWPDIARELRTRYGQGPLAAMRLAHGWSQAEAAEAWNRQWPDSPRTFKNFSYWENWPGPTGHSPSLVVLDALAQLYQCAVTDLIGDWGDHSGHALGRDGAGSEALAWQVQNLDLNELTQAVSVWSRGLPEELRRAGLLKLSTAAAIAAAGEVESSRVPGVTSALASRLTGTWESTYWYASTSRDATFSSDHVLDLRSEEGRMIGQSRADESLSDLTVSLSIDGPIATGTWQERTSPWGHYRAAVYGGLVQMVIDPTLTVMEGRWLGISKRHTIKTGEWKMRRAAQVDASAPPEITTTTVDDVNSPSAIRR